MKLEVQGLNQIKKSLILTLVCGFLNLTFLLWPDHCSVWSSLWYNVFPYR